MRETYEEVRYEGFGPGGVAIIVEALTDNRNRTASDVRAAFSKYGGALGETGSVSFMFNRVGSIIYPGDTGDADAMLEAAIEAGADEFISSSEGHEFLCRVEDFAAVRDALEAKLGPAQSAKIVWRPGNTIPVSDEAGETLTKLLDVLDDHDDVQNVYANYEMSDSLDGEAVGGVRVAPMSSHGRHWHERFSRWAGAFMAIIRIAGFDPGLSRTGWGVIAVDGSKLTHIANGVIVTTTAHCLGVRLAMLHRGIRAVLTEHAPDAVAVEQAFVAKDPLAALKLGHARAIALLAAAEAGLDDRRIRAQSHQEIRGRRRPCRQGAGAGDGEAPVAGGAFRSGRRRRRARLRHRARASGRHAGAHRGGARA